MSSAPNRCLDYTLEEGPRLDWFGDQVILTTAWISGLAGVGFLWRTLTYAHPIVDLRALKDRNFARAAFSPSSPASASLPRFI